MKAKIKKHLLNINLGFKFTIVIALLFASQLSAQQKFTIQLSNGIYKQVPVDGLKLTFDNNGLFTCWQNGLKQDMSFMSVGNIYFTEISLPTGINENSYVFEGLRIYPNPSTGIITLDFAQNNGNKTEVIVLNLIGAEVFRKEMNNADKLQIDLSNQVSGIYLLKVFVDNQEYINKFVIRKK